MVMKKMDVLPLIFLGFRKVDWQSIVPDLILKIMIHVLMFGWNVRT